MTEPYTGWQKVGHIQAGDVYQSLRDGSLAVERDHMFLGEMTQEELNEFSAQLSKAQFLGSDHTRT